MGYAQGAKKYSILTVDDDALFSESLNLILSDTCELVSATDASRAMGILKLRDFDCILLDMGLPEIDGLQFLRILRGLKPHIPVVMLTGNSSAANVVRAIKEGAADYVVKALGEFEEELFFRVSKAIEQQRLLGKAQRLEQKINSENKNRFEIVGHSTPTLKLKNAISRLKGYQTPILILGESGTGKELIARTASLQESNGADRPFIPVNCAAIPENLAESELFGHVKGAFTGALQQQDGKFLAANGGDIFLDEIGDLPLAVQAKLLRVLQEKEVVRVGANEGIKINVRVIAATHKDLKAAVINGTFREDLYYRLAVMTIESPSLKSRPEDIPILVNHFLTSMGSSLKVSPEALLILEAYSWPGNIRALKNCIERAMILANTEQSTKIEPKHIILDSMRILAHRSLLTTVPQDLLPEDSEDINPERLKEYINWAENIFYSKALKITEGNKSKLAEKLAVSRDYIHRKLKSTGVLEEQGATT